MHLESLRHSPRKEQETHPETPLQTHTLSLSKIHCARMVFLCLGNNEFTQTQIERQRPRQKLNQKQGLIWKHSGVWAKLGVTPKADTQWAL